MNRKTILVIILFLFALLFVVYKLVIAKPGGIAGLKVISDPNSSIYLDDKFIGKTPYEGRHSSGEYILKLTSEDGGSNNVPWQDKIILTSGTLTYIKKDLGSSDLFSSGEVVYLEAIDKDEIQLTITSTPDAAVVSIDGLEKGITPLNLPITEGEHDVVVNSTGFIGRTVKWKAVKSFRVVVKIQLALSPESTVSPTPSVPGTTPADTSPSPESSQTNKPYVLIKDTPTGFLRVRLDASLSATEVAQLTPGAKVPYFEEKSGWFKVAYEEGKEGWVSSRYAEKVE
ncbi:hypothetical protein A3I51_00515 [Candidatus Gottesmanbacteria bacterium RIFCSPLOWO2_02_FULL_38_8]|uniref:SH3b domain-containing protein n=1 Tax=Candidatus Gottesmanbacteria bacterium RIFCSPLOWO2_02_FULL_38_8 TaxID=1798397 RepID=A0A1F6B2L3_9BACT|nr:MAG: hypothetical protein A3I51_00515 [Candidatus Gottesmanbacteria bacterium RIFCSPLOWO2_02_FULL_38_8]